MAAEARQRLAERTAAAGTPSALGVQALADALAGPPEQAEERYREAVERLSVTETTTQGYRARLLFGEWLRRANRRTEARVELRAAYEAFSAMGAEMFAERAGRELAATGETVRRRLVGTREELTSQEATIAQLAVSGRGLTRARGTGTGDARSRRAASRSRQGTGAGRPVVHPGATPTSARQAAPYADV
ncbi:hypothetical protein ACGFI9_36130 [Micromonospora sp. NPDC048930]|uniref:hypothetical protein n=1 Tax=Micromonospora sp. NPDC048930 TaxID=3364261 RepID=UPI003711C0E9